LPDCLRRFGSGCLANPDLGGRCYLRVTRRLQIDDAHGTGLAVIVSKCRRRGRV